MSQLSRREHLNNRNQRRAMTGKFTLHRKVSKLSVWMLLAETSQPIGQPKAKSFHSQNVAFFKSESWYSLPRARGLVLRNHHTPLKTSGLTLIYRHLELKIILENVNLNCCCYTKDVTNSFDPWNWNFLKSPSHRFTSCTLHIPLLSTFSWTCQWVRKVRLEPIYAHLCCYPYPRLRITWASIYKYIIVNSACVSLQTKMLL